MVSSIDRTSKTQISSGKSREMGQRSPADKSTLATENTLLDVLAQHLVHVPVDQRQEHLAQLLVAEVLEANLGLSGVSEPEYARMVESIKNNLLSSSDAMTRINQALVLVEEKAK
ncbi:hypothetical protein [Arsukibacterium perlucidum]|uniref:hypothetical protein n=1 Tax=Arsukibacterium perlucidum TaxID=368811 RepID=UPI000364B0F1|nr:hypothetical protein [Arsukibacterium perlucidum]